MDKLDQPERSTFDDEASTPYAAASTLNAAVSNESAASIRARREATRLVALRGAESAQDLAYVYVILNNGI